MALTECIIDPELDTTVNYQAEPHFAANDSVSGYHLPYTVFTDPEQPPNQCGDLDFTNERTRWVKSWYATWMPGESPWKYWWRRARRAETGEGDRYDPGKVYRDSGSFAWDSIAVPLDDQYDAIAVILLITSDSSLVINDTAFLDPAYHAWENINMGVQHWAHRPAPTSVSARRDGADVTLSWHNEHQGRTLDSTNIYRGSTYLTTVGPSDTSYVDSGLAPDTYAYHLKHVSVPAINTQNITGLPFPNSLSSDTVTVTVPDTTPPPPLDMDISGTDLIMEDDWYAWTMVTTGGTTPYSPYRWEERPFRNSGGTVVGTDSSYTDYVHTTDPWFWLRAVVYDDADPPDSVVRFLAIETWDGGSGGAALGVLAGVGVRLRDGTCSPRRAVGDPGRQAWLQMIMTTVERIEYCGVVRPW